MLLHTGRFFFRFRNALFPAVFCALVLLAPPRAFGNPAWDCIAVGALFAIAAGQSLRVITIGLDYVKRGGKKKQIYADRLVRGGVYAHCRNPMYVGNLLVAFGMLALVGQPWTLAIGLAFFAFVYFAIVRSEEQYLLDRFGEKYREYCRRSPRWVVRLSGLPATLRRYRFDWPAVIVKEYGTVFTTLMTTAAVIACKLYRSGTLDRFLPHLIITGAVLIGLHHAAWWLKKHRDLKPHGSILRHPKPQLADIEHFRDRIDDIDRMILELLNRRAVQVAAVLNLKKAAGIERFDPHRTEAILRRLTDLNRGPLTNEDVRQIYSDLLYHFAHEFQSSPAHLATPLVEVIGGGVQVINSAR